MKNHDEIVEKLTFVYGEQKAQGILDQIEQLKNKYAKEGTPDKAWVDESDIMLITYGDSIKEEGKAPLQTLDEFLVTHAKEEISAVHILPFYPYSSDDGFSVIDYKEVNPELGNWDDVKNLSNHFDLMFDGVINHISQHSEWFQEYLKGNPDYENYFVEADPNADYSKVTRPRALPLLTKFETNKGTKYIWTTFSDDQIDLNFENEKVFLEILELLMMYSRTGARFIRLDAIGFMWKKLGTTCIHLEETHNIIQIYRKVLDEVVPGTILITETNVPHKDNISYFGNGYNEAQMVYQFPLPPLTLYTFHNANSTELSKWADSLEPTTEQTAFFNFLASHDGIGVRPVEGILTPEEVQAMADKVIENGGFVSYKDNGDGTKSPYELNINYLEALSNVNDSQHTKISRFIASQSILLSMMGVPGIYVHSLLGSGNDVKGVEATGRYRSINREKLNRDELEAELQNPESRRSLIFNQYKKMIAIRKSQKAFHPNATQEVLFLNEKLFSLKRTSLDEKEVIYVLINVSNETVKQEINISEGTSVTDLVSNQTIAVNNDIELAPYQVMWLKA